MSIIGRLIGLRTAEEREKIRQEREQERIAQEQREKEIKEKTRIVLLAEKNKSLLKQLKADKKTTTQQREVINDVLLTGTPPNNIILNF